MTTALADLVYSISRPVFLFEITASDGNVAAPVYKPLTLGRFTLGTLPYKVSGSGETVFNYSDRDWTEKQTTPPSYTLDFTQSMPAGLTFSRASTAWGFNKDGIFTSYSNNVPRVAMRDISGAPRGLLMEGARTNLVDNSDCNGATPGVVGGSGSLPNNWYGEWDGNTLWTVVGTGFDNGMPYVDLNISGLGADSSPVILMLVGFDSVNATSGNVMTGSVFVKQVGGTQDNVNYFACRVSGFNSVSRNQTEDSETQFDVREGVFTRGEHTHTYASGSTDRGTVELVMGIDLGVPLDITLRIALPQLEAGYFASSPIVTSGTAVTRAADSCYVATSTWFSSSVDTIAVQAAFDSLSTNTAAGRTLYSFDNNSAAELVVNSVFGKIPLVVVNHSSSQVVNISSGLVGAKSTYRSAARLKTSSWRYRTNFGNTATSGAGTFPTVNQLCIGCWGRSNELAFGYIDKILIWKALDNDAVIDALPFSALPPVWAYPTSTKANVYFEGRCNTLDMDRTIPLVPEATSRAALSLGDISINNSDGLFDTLTSTYAVDGRDISVKLLDDPSDIYDDALEVFAGVGVNWVADLDQATIKVRERSFFLDVPLLGLFGGTGGADGTSANAGHVIPQVYGFCRNITAELIDPTKLIYRFHDRQASDVVAVYDRGAPVTKANSYASFAALSAASTGAGTYDYALTTSGSFFRLGSSPSGSITADVRGDASSGYASTVGSIIKLLMLRGAVLGDIDTSSLTALDAALTGEMGIYFSSQTSIAEAIDQVCTGTFTFWGDIGTGLLGAYRLADPSVDTPTYVVDEFAIDGEVQPLELPDTIGPTVWRRRIGYRINWTQMYGTDIVPAPTITEARRKQLQDQFLTFSTGDASRLVKNMLAVDAPTMLSLFDNQSDASALAANLLDLYRPGRGLWSVPLNVSGYRVQLNSTILLKWPRYGLADGKLVKVVGVSYKGDTVTLTVFG